MRWLAVGVAAWLAAMAGLGQSAVADQPSADAAAVRAQVGRVYEWAGFQRDLPEGPERPTSAVPSRIKPGGLANVILIGGVVLLVAMVVARLHAGGWRRLPAPAPVGLPDDAPAASRTEKVQSRLQDAEHFAVSADWGTAIHILLLTSIELLNRRIGQDIPVAMTARELIRHAMIDDRWRDDFAALVAAAEWVHFGGRRADRTLYVRCRDHYERLWGGPPEAST